MDAEQKANYKLDKNIFRAHDIFCPKENIDYYFSVYDLFNGGSL